MRPMPKLLTMSLDGVVTITWPATGLYWIDASVADEKATVPNVKTRRASYNGTFEVLPQ